MIRVLADENIALMEEFQSPDMEFVLRAGRGLRAEDLMNIDALLVRSVTEVNQQLLQNTPVRFVGSATAGIDHLDINYLNNAGIAYSYAPGSNADSVVDYVLCCLAAIGRDPQGASIGIIGCGQVGRRLYRRMKALGCDCFCYDPFLGEDQQADLCGLEQVLAADIVSLHTPLTNSGPYPTENMINMDQLKELRAGAVLINAGRGGVINESALKDHLSGGEDIQLVFDVWKGEPNIDADLVELCQIATPHIAGYAARAKLRGSQMVFEALCQHFALANPLPASGKPEEADVTKDNQWDSALLSVYDPRHDDQRLRVNLGDFDQLRKSYPARSELAEHRSENKVLQNFGFSKT